MMLRIFKIKIIFILLICFWGFDAQGKIGETYSSTVTENDKKSYSRKRVAIVPFSNRNASEMYADIARDMFEIHLHKNGVFTIIERNC